MNSRYELRLKSEETGEVYSFESADGLNSKNSFRDEEILLADEVDINEDERVLIVQSGYGFLGVTLGKKAGEVVMQDTSARACKYSRNNAEKNSVENFETANEASISGIEDDFNVVVYAPAGYSPVDLVKKRLREAVGKLEEDGELYISGRKKSGIKRYRNYLEDLPGETDRIAIRDGNHVYRFSPVGEIDVSGPDIEREFRAEVRKAEAGFRTAEGLFSPGKLDDGTKLLLENLELEEGSKVLDLACGYGAISTVIGKIYRCELYLTDDNARAVHYAEENLEGNGVEKFEATIGDCMDGFEDEKFDFIVSNPPTHQGKGVTQKIFRQTHESLYEGGELWLVYNQNMEYEEQLEQKFSSVETIAKRSNFIVVKARR